MHDLISILLVAVAVILSIPTAVLVTEIFAGLAPRADVKRDNAGIADIRIAVVVPAHDESAGILETLEDIRTQLKQRDRLLVVADNCSDDTADVARRAGTEVIERHDSSRLGKGYALAFSIEHLTNDPPDIVVIVDADCRLGDGAIETLTGCAVKAGRPAQALYLMAAPKESSINHAVSEFAWRIKNWLRPQGLANLGLPCQLMGTGMAFPWRVIRAANLATGSIVEDIKLGLELASNGTPPVFCPDARVESEFAASVGGALSQRQRWEHGHLQMILTSVPRLLLSALARRNFALLVLVLDISVPPLALFGGLLGLAWLIMATAAVFGFGGAALEIGTGVLGFWAFALGAAWWRFGRDVLRSHELIQIPFYVLGKVSIYRNLLSGRVSSWARTDRGHGDDEL